MFSRAEAYERFMGRWSRLLGPPFVAFAGTGDHVLDVGCGTGALTLTILDANPTARVTGVDPAPDFIAYASREQRATFEVGDAQSLRFADATFDRTLSMLVINFTPDPVRTAQEMRRVTKPGGVVAAAVWDYAGAMEMLRVFWDHAVALDPAADPRDERHMPMCGRGELAALWTQQGLVEVEETALSVALRFTSFDDYWAPFLLGQGPAGAYAASLSADQQTALARALRARLLGGDADHAFELSVRAWAVTGRTPGA